MRALILSDIHANLEALDAVLEAAPEHDVVWILGDSVGYGACPNEVIDRISCLGSVFVRGNHDRACCGLASLADFNPVAARAAVWTAQVLTPEHIQWLRELDRGPVHLSGRDVTCMHGSLIDEDEYLLSVRDAWRPLREVGTKTNFFGHTHVQGGFATDGEEWFNLLPGYASADQAEDFELPLSSSARYLINPGSVGQPRDGDWRAAFAVFDDERMAVRFFRVPYDVARAQQRIYRVGLPDRLALRLREGR